MIASCEEFLNKSSHDTNTIIDLDMYILAQPWAVYEQYAQAIMKEYLPVQGEEAYRANRPTRFLQPAINSGAIFITNEFRPLAAQAVRNMEREIDILASGKSFGGKELS